MASSAPTLLVGGEAQHEHVWDPEGQGAWGRITCEGDSQEANYHHTVYVAELWGTVTCVVWVAVSAWCVLRSRRCGDSRALQALYGVHALAGLCGVAYHTTLWLSAQVLDRTSVLWWLLLVAYNMRMQHPRRQESVLPYVVCCVLSPLSTPWGAHQQLFIAAAVWAGYSAIGVCRSKRLRNDPTGELVRKWVRAAVLSAIACGAFKADDVGWGTAHGFTHFHSLWHLLAMAATHEIMAFLRQSQRLTLPTRTAAAGKANPGRAATETRTA